MPVASASQAESAWDDMNRNGVKGEGHVTSAIDLRCSGMITPPPKKAEIKVEQTEKTTACETVTRGKTNKPCPQIARSSGRDHRCAVASPHICFAAWQRTVVCAEKAVRVYHLWHRSMGLWQLAAGKAVRCKGFTGRRKSQQGGAVMSAALLSARLSHDRAEKLINVHFTLRFTAAEQSWH